MFARIRLGIKGRFSGYGRIANLVRGDGSNSLLPGAVDAPTAQTLWGSD